MNAKTKGEIMQLVKAGTLVGSIFLTVLGANNVSKTNDSTQIKLNEAKNEEQDRRFEKQEKFNDKMEKKIDDLPNKIVEQIEKHLKYLESKKK